MINNSNKKSLRYVGGIIGKTVSYIIMGTFALMAIIPIIWLIINSFKSTVEFRTNMLGLPKIWTLKNYAGAWKIGNFDKLMVNSFFYTIAAILGSIFFSLLAGFAFSKIKSKATIPIYGSFLMGILLTTQSLMVPLFLEVSQLDRLLGDFFQLLGLMRSTNFHLFYNTRFGVLLIYIGSALPLGIFLSTEYIKSIPISLIEAARIDGAGYWRIFLSIILPMTIPIITTIAIIQIPTIWNEFALINILVSKIELRSMPLGIFRFSGTLATDYGKQFAALVIGMAPMLIFYMLFRKQLTKGVSAGAVKG
jgi:raffinose/stachyose/melibiose transport system permease protein